MKKMISLDEMRKKMIPNGEKIPEGFYTMKEYAVVWKISHCRVDVLIKRAVEEGIMEKKLFKIPTDNGGLRSVNHFKVKE